MLTTIACGYDKSPGAGAALPYARALAALTGARLVVASAFPSNPLLVRLRTAFESRTAENAEADLAAAAERLGPDVDAMFAAVDGPSAHAALHDLAEREQADLLVLGATRHVEAYLQRSPCPVVLVPPDAGPPRLARIGVGCDGSSASRTAVWLARELSDLPEGPVRQLDLVVVEPPGLHHHLEVHDPGLFVKEPSPTSTWLERVARERRSRTRVRVVQRDGDPAEVLKALSERWDLLIVGSRSRGPLRRLLLGSVSVRLAREAPCPVLVVPRLRRGEQAESANARMEELAASALRDLRRRSVPVPRRRKSRR